MVSTSSSRFKEETGDALQLYVFSSFKNNIYILHVRATLYQVVSAGNVASGHGTFRMATLSKEKVLEQHPNKNKKVYYFYHIAFV